MTTILANAPIDTTLTHTPVETIPDPTTAPTTCDTETTQKPAAAKVTHSRAVDFDLSRMVARGGVKAVKGKNNIKLLNLTDTQFPGTYPKVEMHTPLKMLYDFDPARGKITLKLGSRNYKYRSVLAGFQTRAMTLASEHSPDGWSVEDLKNLYWSKPNMNEVRLKIVDKLTKIWEITDLDTMAQKDGDLSLLRRGNIFFPVAQQSFIWYTGDNCGLTQTAAGLAVIPKSLLNPFDFLLPNDKGEFEEDSNLTNRLFQTVNFDQEADFTRDKSEGKHGNISYYLNIDDFQMNRTRCPFGFNPRVDDVTGVEADYATVEFELDDDTEAFCQSVNNSLLDNLLKEYGRWFGSVPDFVNKEFLKEKKIFKNFYTPTNSKYRGLYSVKAYKTGHPLETEYWVYNSDNQTYRRGTHLDLKKQCQALPVISLSKMHFKGSGNRYSRIGSTLILERVVIFPSKQDVITGMLLFQNAHKRKRKTTTTQPVVLDESTAPDTKRTRADAEEEDPTANSTPTNTDGGPNEDAEESNDEDYV